MATTITTINAGDQISASRTVINNNFSSLNSNKIETDVLDVDTSLSANSDAKIPSQKAVKAYVDALGGITNLVPTGAILPYGASTAPTYYLLCDGTAVSRSTYATLFGIIGTTYGVGNGSTTFNVPDLRGRFPLGYASSGQSETYTFSSRSSDTITVTGATNTVASSLQTGQAVLYHTSGSVITGLSNDTTYYLIRVAYNQFKLATSITNANVGTAITLSGDGTGTQTFVLSFTARALAEKGGIETQTTVPSHYHTYFPYGSGGTGNYADAANPNGTSENTSTVGSDTPNNMPPYAVVNFIIKT